MPRRFIGAPASPPADAGGVSPPPRVASVKRGGSAGRCRHQPARRRRSKSALRLQSEPNGMRTAKVERVKRRVLRQAVAENLEVIRGMPPRALRPANRLWRLWLRRASFLIVPLTLVGSSYIIANGNSQSAVVTRMSALPIVQLMKRPQPIAPEARGTAERMTS